MPDRLLERASSARNEWRPEPLWMNFQALFGEINGGNEGRGIWAYNGGLFAADPVADALVIPDPLATDLAALGQDFLNRERNLHFKPAAGESIRSPPKGGRESERCEPCDQEPEREEYDRFDHIPHEAPDMPTISYRPRRTACRSRSTCALT